MNTSLESSYKKKRIEWVDTFRAVMIFCIALGHALGIKPIDSGVINQYLYSFHVAAFFFISGFLFSSKKLSFSAFFVKKAKTILIPYYVFSIISIAVFTVLGNVASKGLGVSVESTDIWSNICGMLYANGDTGYMKWNLPLWFLPCLFCISLLFYGLEKAIYAICRKTSKNTAGIAIIAVSFAASFANYYVFDIDKLPFGFETAIYMLPFFTAGYLLRNNCTYIKMPVLPKTLIGIASLCIGALLAFVYEPRVKYISSEYNNLFVFYLSAFLTVIGFVFISQLVSGRYISYVGSNTISVLVLHKFPIVLFQLLLADYMTESELLGSVVAVIITVVSCALSLAVGAIIKRVIPFALGGRD